MKFRSVDPYSETGVKRIDRLFTNFVQILLRLSPKEFNFYKHVNLILNKNYMSFTSVEMPIDTDMELKNLIFAEILPVERAKETRQGLSRLLQDCPPRSFAALTNDDNIIRNFFDSFESQAWGLGTARIAYIDIPTDTKVAKLVSSLEIVAYRISSTLAVLRFRVNLSDDFVRTVKKLLKSDYRDEQILRFQISRLTRYQGWGSRTIGSDQRKSMELRAAVTKCQLQVCEFIDRYIPLYFTRKNLSVPSIEIYSANRTSSLRGIEDRSNHFNLFWSSIGMTLQGTLSHDIADDGHTELFSDDLWETGTLKILVNNMSDKSINHIMEYSSGNVVVLLVVYWYFYQVSKRVQQLRAKLFGIVAKRRKRLGLLLSTSVLIQEEAQLFNRVSTEITAKLLRRFSFFGNEFFKQLKAVGMRHSERPSIVTGLEKGIQNHIDALKSEVKSLQTISKEATEIYATRSTMRGQWVTIVLAVITAILTGITIYVTEHPLK